MFKDSEIDFLNFFAMDCFVYVFDEEVDPGLLQLEMYLLLNSTYINIITLNYLLYHIMYILYNESVLVRYHK